MGRESVGRYQRGWRSYPKGQRDDGTDNVTCV